MRCSCTVVSLLSCIVGMSSGCYVASDMSDKVTGGVSILGPLSMRGFPWGEPRNLQILHHHNDGSYEAIWPHISGGTASFTLTSFSTFAFANKIEASDLPEDCPFSAGACSRPYCTGWPEIRGCQGPVRGREGGTYYLEPRGEATRAECAAMLMRFSERYK